MSQLPEHVDVIIVGTGLTNSILAAACSRIGKSVLHLDENSYYGNDWASFTFQQLLDWIKIRDPNIKCLSDVPEELIKKSRMFCLDLAPRFLFSNGEMVDLLVKSNVARYHEFKNNIRILCLMGDDIQVMPCRRNEVFASPLLSNLADKRRLMKFIELCLKYDKEFGDDREPSDIDEFGDQPIAEYLEGRGLKENLREYIINSIAMVKPNETLRVTCEKIQNFMIATERYGRSPFLFPLYGCGEFPQSFCRLSAVFGGVYCLNTHIKNVSTCESQKGETALSGCGDDARKQSTSREPGNYKVTFSKENHEVRGDMLVLERTDAVKLRLIDESSPEHMLSRAILITRKSIVECPESNQAKDLVSFLRIQPSEGNKNVVFLIELNSSALVCPNDLNIVYLWTRSSTDDPESDLQPTVERLFLKNSHNVVWKFYYQQLTGAEQPEVDPASERSSSNLHITSPSCDDIDYANTIKEAKRLFSQMCPDQEFLPRAPDPDEIVST